MLIITNGDAAGGAIAAAPLPLQSPLILPWRDVLHAGPVPPHLSLPELSQVRARFLAACGWSDEQTIRDSLRKRDEVLSATETGDEVLLWFEHDLYDQLQLLQVLDWFAGRPERPDLRLICEESFVAEQEPAQLLRQFQQRQRVTEAHLREAVDGWKAVRSGVADQLNRAAGKAEVVLNFVPPALRRLIQEFPRSDNGLSRIEQAVLEVISQAGAASPGRIFQGVQAREQARFLGDAPFWLMIQELVDAARPALKTKNGTPFRPPSGSPDDSFRNIQLQLTRLGRELLAAKADWISENGLDKWIGGFHLTDANYCRHDIATARLSPASLEG